MRKVGGWIGLLFAAIVGVGLTLIALYIWAPYAPYLWALIVLPLGIGASGAALLARPFTQRAGIAQSTGATLAACVAILPLGGLVAAVLLSPQLPRAAPGPDPRGPHKTLRTKEGSSLAYWSIAPAVLRHRTPVIFLHGGPGTFARNRDFDAAKGFRDAGFRTVFYDQSGSGASGDLPLADYTIPRMVGDLDALRVALGAERIVLWGQSWGASLAAAYVRAHPDRIAATILDSPGDFPGQPLPLDYSKTDTDGGFEPNLREATLYLLIGNAPQLAERWQSQTDLRATQQARSSKINYIYGYQCKGAATKLRRPLSPAGGSLYPQLLLQNSLEAQPKITGTLSDKPALLIRGDCDYLPLATAAMYLQAFPAAERIDVPNRGHAFFGHETQLAAILNGYASKNLGQIP